VFLALGANVGDPARQIRDAVLRLGNHVEVVGVSSLYRSEPVGYLDQPDFLNAVVEVRSELTPRELLEMTQAMEEAAGRHRPFAGAPRTLDIDIVLYGDLRMHEPDLDIPHPRWKERAFVLWPLVEIAPDVVDPDTGLAVRALCAALRVEGAVPERVAGPETFARGGS